MARVCELWVQVRGAEIEAEFKARPAPASRPPRVVEAVPPTLTERVEEEVMAEFPLPISGWPAVVLVAMMLPEVRVPEMRALPWTERS